jgi:hypothetical protein
MQSIMRRANGSVTFLLLLINSASCIWVPDAKRSPVPREGTAAAHDGRWKPYYTEPRRAMTR